jgi:cytochrome c553
MRWKKKEAMKRFAQLCGGLCLVASVAAGLASGGSTAALPQSVPAAQARGKAIYQRDRVACHAQHNSYLVNRLRQFASTSLTVKIAAHEVDDHTIVAIAAYLSSLPTVDDDSAKPPP